MRKKDYIPRGNGAFDAWGAALLAYAQAKTLGQGAPWTHIPTQVLADLTEHFQDWHELYLKAAAGGRTSGDIALRNERRRLIVEPEFRRFVKKYLSEPPVTDADRVSMGIRPKDIIRTTINRPVEHVGLEVIPTGPHRHTIRRWVLETNETATPYAYNARLWYKIGGEAPTNHDELNRSMRLRSKRTVLDHKPEDSGKTCYYDALWENEKGEPGPWGEGIVSAVIP